MRKQMMLAAPIVAAMAFVCQPAFGADTPGSTAVDSAANDAGRAIGQAGNELNRAAETGATSVDAAAQDAADAAQVAGSRVDAKSMRNMSKDQKFAMKVADMNNFEIQAGQLAAQKAQSDDIKQLAQMTVDDHTKAQQKLQQIAQQKNIQMSQQLMPVHQAMLTELSQMEGKDFEKAYLYGQVAGHTKAMLKLRDAQSELQDPELKAYAAEIQPKIQMHLKHANRLAQADDAMTAGARMSGKSDAHGSHESTGSDGSGSGKVAPGRSDSPGDANRGAGPSGADNSGTSPNGARGADNNQ